MLPPPEAKLDEPICTRAEDVLGKLVDLIIHGGYLGQQPTTVIDLTEDAPEVVREGVGDVQPFR
ncbi:Sua5/YciO/YrdC/YwlC family protein [Erwinia tasmaniensis]|uniref:Sua5/YciO/YrdC/YwlC family protein n=1 Tax=Erwinia tasmaniensis TaxID=338565 RepID=UPI002F428938